MSMQTVWRFCFVCFTFLSTGGCQKKEAQQTESKEKAEKKKPKIVAPTQPSDQDKTNPPKTPAERNSPQNPKSPPKAKSIKSCFDESKIPVSAHTQELSVLYSQAKGHGMVIDTKHGGGEKALLDKIVCASWVDFSGDGIKDLVMRVTYKHSSGWQIEPDHLLFYRTSRKSIIGTATVKKKTYKDRLMEAGYVSLAGEALFAKALKVINPGGGVAVAFGIRFIHQYSRAPALGLYAFDKNKVTQLGLIKTPGCSVDTGGCGKCNARLQANKTLPPRKIALKGHGNAFRVHVKGFDLKKCVPTPVKKTYRVLKKKLKAL